MQSFGDKAFGDFGTIGVGGVDEIYAKFDGPAKNPAGFFWICWFAPGAITDPANGAIAQAIDRQVAADKECAARRGRCVGHYT